MLLQELDTMSNMTLKDIQAQKMSIGNVLTSIDIHALGIIINSIKGLNTLMIKPTNKLQMHCFY